MTKTKTVQKVFGSMIAFAMVVTMSFGFLVTPTAQAQTIEELNAKIATLLAQVEAFQAQLGQTSGVTGMPTGFTFTSNLSMGATGMEVMRLQQFLNADAQTRVAATGAGSPGNETQNFGSLTRGAVMNFQAKYAAEVLAPLNLVSPTGFWGASSRAKANALIAVTPPPANDEPANDEPANDEPANDEPANDDIGTPGVEGDITVTLAPVPVDNTILEVGGSNQSVLGFEVEAHESDLVLNRVDLNFNKRGWLWVDHVALFDGENAIAGKSTTGPSDFLEVSAGTDYRLRFSGLNVVVPAGTTKTLTVKVGTPSTTHTSVAGNSLEISVEANAVRATDGAGLSQTAPAGPFLRTVTVAAASATGNAVVTLHTDNPSARPVQVNETGTTDAELLRFNVKAENRAMTVRTMKIGITESASAVQTVRLYAGNTLLGTAGVTGGLATFTNLSTEIARNVTQEFRVDATFKAQNPTGASAVYAEGTTVSASFTPTTAANFVAEDTEFETVTTSSAALTGANASLYLVVPELALTSLSNTLSSATLANASVVFSVKALGGDVYLPRTSATALTVTGSPTASSLSSPAQSGDVATSVKQQNTIEITAGTASAGVNTITATVNGVSTAAIDWAASHGDTATALASAIDALSGVDASATGAVVTVVSATAGVPYTITKTDAGNVVSDLTQTVANETAVFKVTEDDTRTFTLSGHKSTGDVYFKLGISEVKWSPDATLTTATGVTTVVTSSVTGWETAEVFVSN